MSEMAGKRDVVPWRLTCKKCQAIDVHYMTPFEARCVSLEGQHAGCGGSFAVERSAIFP